MSAKNWKVPTELEVWYFVPAIGAHMLTQLDDICLTMKMSFRYSAGKRSF